MEAAVLECSGVPGRSMQQRMEALAVANAVRVWRAQLKRDIGAGVVDARVVLAEPPVMAGSMKVFDLLLAMPKTGRVKANRVLARGRIAPSKTLAGLTERQRVELLALLPHR